MGILEAKAYCGKADFGHIFLSFSFNRTTIGFK
jgi:hypothetical protein